MFWVLTILALVLSLAGGTVFVAQIDPPKFLDALADPLSKIEPELVIVVASLTLPALFIFAAYLASFAHGRRRRRRPVGGLYLLGFSIAWLVMAFVATMVGAKDFFAPIPLAIAGAALLILAAMPRLIEIAIGWIFNRIGCSFLNAKQWRMAASILGAARRLLPGDDRLASDHGIALYELGQTERALPVLAEAYRRGERDPRIVKALAESALELPEELAIEILTDMLRLRPGNAKFGRRLVELHLQRKRPADALPVLEQFYDANNIEDVSLLARLNAEEGRVDRALELIRRAVELEGPPFQRSLADLQILALQAPRNTAVLATLAELHEKAGNRDEAIAWYGSLIEADESNADARRQLIRIHRQLGRLDETIPYYRELLARQPDSCEVALEYGRLLEDKQEFEKALEIFRDFADRCPDNHRFDYHMAVCLFGLAQLEEAAAALERARDKAPANERPRIQMLATRIQSARVESELGVLRKQANQPEASLELRLGYVERLIAYQQAEQATRELDLLLHQQPDKRGEITRFLEGSVERGTPQFLVLSILADIYLNDREFDRSHALYANMAKQSLHPDEVLSDGCKKILRLNTEHLPSLKSLAELMLRGSHYREAARVLGKILDLSPPAREDLLPMLFEVYYQLGDPDRAIPYGDELLKRDSQNLNLYLRMREMMVKREDHMGATRIVQSALELAPGNRQLREMLEESELALKQQHIEALRQQIEAAPDNAGALHELGDIYVELDRLNDAITTYQRAAQNAEGNLRNLCLIKLAHCLARKSMFDLADETIAETELHEKSSEFLEAIKNHLYQVGRIFEIDEQFMRALTIYKRIFRLDAGYKDVVNKIEVLSHLKSSSS